MNKWIGERCKIARESAGFKQTYAAGMLNLTARSLRSWESGGAKDNLATLLAMAYIYEVSLNWLLLNIGPMKLDAPMSSLYLVWNGIPEKTRDTLWPTLVNFSEHKPMDKLTLSHDELNPHVDVLVGANKLNKLTRQGV